MNYTYHKYHRTNRRVSCDEWKEVIRGRSLLRILIMATKHNSPNRWISFNGMNRSIAHIDARQKFY